MNEFIGDIATLRDKIERLEKQNTNLREIVHWMAQTIHQAHHTDHPGTFLTCKKNTCDAATQTLNKGKNFGAESWIDIKKR